MQDFRDAAILLVSSSIFQKYLQDVHLQLQVIRYLRFDKIPLIHQYSLSNLFQLSKFMPPSFQIILFLIKPTLSSHIIWAKN